MGAREPFSKDQIMHASTWLVDNIHILSIRRQQFVSWGSIAFDIFKKNSKSLFVLGYPRSGTNWVCYLLSKSLDLPVLEPWKRITPTITPVIFHTHRFIKLDTVRKRTVYVIRDGRDVVISVYFFILRDGSRAFKRRLGQALPCPFDASHIVDNLPNFIRYLMLHSFSGPNYKAHLATWRQFKSRYVTVRYEDLLRNTTRELENLYTLLYGEAPNDQVKANVLRATRECDFAKISGRPKGSEDASSFLRKGIHGDWRNYYTKEAASIYQLYAGDLLQELGYESDNRWINTCR